MKIQDISGLEEAHPLELLNLTSRTGQKAKNPYLAMLMYKVKNNKPMSRQEQADLKDYLAQAGVKFEGKGDFPWQDDVTKHQQKQLVGDYDKDIKRLGQQALAKAKAAVMARPKIKEGGIDHEANAMVSAVTGRILRAHPDLLSKYGPEAVMQAIDDVTFGDDWEEIGTSDVSAYVKQVERYLSDRHGVSEGFMSEVDIELHNIAQSEDEEELIDAMEGLKGTGVQIALEDMMSDLADELAAKGMNDIINDQDRMIELLMDKVVAEFGEGDIDTNESLRPGEHHVATVTFTDGTEKKVKITTDEGFRDMIKNHFAKQGLTVKDIEVDWSVKSESETNERELTKHELDRREEIVKGMKKSAGDFEKRYGDRAKAVMYATATKMAKNEDINESARMAADEGHYYCEAERQIKPIPEGYVKVARGYIMKKA